MNKKAISIVIAGLITFSASPQLSAIADESCYSSEMDGDRSTGLIVDASLGCSSGTKTIYINAEVCGSAVMSKIGFKNIKIQRSTNQSNWTTEKTISDKIDEDAVFKKLSSYPVSVDGGYYYRIVLDNYAKENTWWFPETQTLTTTSNYVWIS